MPARNYHYAVYNRHLWLHSYTITNLALVVKLEKDPLRDDYSQSKWMILSF